MAVGQSSQHSYFASPWSLEAAQAQMDAIAAALMPLGRSASGRVQVPSVEIEDTAAALIVTAFLPGVDPQAVRVRATPTSLTFSGHRQSSYGNALMQSLGINYFQQTVPLPARVIDRQVQVAYRQGALVVTLPKHRGWRQRLLQGWQQAKVGLGRSLQGWGQRLLDAR
ncbi:Hsp20/alpha crystallin family protein [Nodosilinea sp. E11]|uniref:Hsp20/alpha crystallin family protein n=1 Tax=Nodosilinea sp. E11 TaxID=3037479 RepID=UPI002934F36E|nr:Hsp20/alpha crystallin family protein [Nodosilinea sp. E11]WOD39465.1 Hsp20/alpha crystallin family protein [Nodosilinea sp. E11]